MSDEVASRAIGACSACGAAICEGRPYQVWFDYVAYHRIGYSAKGPILRHEAVRLYCGVCRLLAPEGQVEDAVVSHEEFAALEREHEAERQMRLIKPTQ